MKRLWPRIISTFTTLAVGLVAASIMRLFPVPAASIKPVYRIDSQDAMITALRLVPTSYHVYKEPRGVAPSWTAKKNETFGKGAVSQKIKFDPPHSEAIEGLGTPLVGGPVTSTDFLQYNYGELAEIAAGGNAKQKAWLRNYLETSDESALKRSLLAALEGVQP